MRSFTKRKQLSESVIDVPSSNSSAEAFSEIPFQKHMNPFFFGNTDHPVQSPPEIDGYSCKRQLAKFMEICAENPRFEQVKS